MILCIHVLNGRLFNDIQGEFTCFVNNGASVVGYMIASTNLFPYFSDFGVSDILFSIHCPVYCTLKLERHCVQSDSVPGEKLKSWEKIKWNESMKGDFLERFRNIFNNFGITFENSGTSAIDKLSAFIRMFQDEAVNMKCKNRTRNFANKQSPWWNSDCDQAKKVKYQALRTFRQTNSLVDLDVYFTARNRFKAITRNCENEYQKQNRHRLVEARNNPKKFWNTLKQEAEKTFSVNSCTIFGTDWFNYKGLLTSQTAEADDSPILDNIRQENLCDMLNLPISGQEIRESVSEVT